MCVVLSIWIKSNEMDFIVWPHNTLDKNSIEFRQICSVFFLIHSSSLFILHWFWIQWMLEGNRKKKKNYHHHHKKNWIQFKTIMGLVLVVMICGLDFSFIIHNPQPNEFGKKTRNRKKENKIFISKWWWAIVGANFFFISVSFSLIYSKHYVRCHHSFSLYRCRMLSSLLLLLPDIIQLEHVKRKREGTKNVILSLSHSQRQQQQQLTITIIVSHFFSFCLDIRSRRTKWWEGKFHSNDDCHEWILFAHTHINTKHSWSIDMIYFSVQWICEIRLLERVYSFNNDDEKKFHDFHLWAFVCVCVCCGCKWVFFWPVLNSRIQVTKLPPI